MTASSNRLEAIRDREITDWVVLLCQSERCAIRYPSPSDDVRFGSCPICKSPSQQVERYPAEDDLIAPLSGEVTKSEHRLWVLCDNIRSAANAGVIIRTADGAGFEKVTLTGITAKPNSNKIAKSALGAQDELDVGYESNALDVAIRAKEQGWKLIGLEYTFDSVSLNPVTVGAGTLGSKTMLVLGHERAGIDPEIRRLLDLCWHLDMAGVKGSHNVSAAFAAAAYALRWISLKANT